MMIVITPKKLRKVVVSATFEHEGVGYEEKFVSRKRFISFLKRTRDAFINAVDYEKTLVINQFNIREYIG